MRKVKKKKNKTVLRKIRGKKQSHALWCRSLTPASPGLGEDEPDELWSAAVLLQSPKLLIAMGLITKPTEASEHGPAQPSSRVTKPIGPTGKLKTRTKSSPWGRPSSHGHSMAAWKGQCPGRGWHRLGHRGLQGASQGCAWSPP